jgi:general secretion pathway protein L
MPINDDGWSAIALGENEQQFIVRQGLWQGSTLDASAWQLQCHLLSQPKELDETPDDNKKVSIEVKAYSSLTHSEQLTITEMPEELPLMLLAQSLTAQVKSFNLLQGEYKVKESRSNAGQQWLWVAGVAVFALLLSLGHKSAQLWALNTEQEKVSETIITTYKKAFPKTKRVRVSTIKSQLNRELALLGGVNDSQGFLAMLAQVQPAFAKVPALKPESLKFDGKRQELRIQAQAKDYQAFELFSNALDSADLAVKLGSQSNQGDQVTGSFSISNKANNKSASKRKGAAQQRSTRNNKEAS